MTKQEKSNTITVISTIYGAIMRYSSQRELVLNTVKERCDHPTADMVYASCRLIDPTISLGTVYRNLKVLEECKEITSIETNDVKLHYDGNLTRHCHFICTKCGSIIDIMSIPRIPRAVREVGKIESSKCVFYGTCKSCQQ